jgi:hypothetical protein
MFTTTGVLARRSALGSVLVAGALLFPPDALAERFASPTGDASAATTCPISDPCDIATAIEDASVIAGDVITILPGDYTLGPSPATLSPLVNPVTIRAQPGGARPRIVVADNAMSVGSGTLVQGLSVEGTTGSFGVSASGATLERMEIRSTSPNDAAVILQNGSVLRDSFASTNLGGVSGDAVRVFGGGTLSNVTAIGLGVGSDGVIGAAETQTVTLRNVIARGDGAGIRAEDDGDADNLDINVSYSNYSSIVEAEPDADVILGAGNQTAAPLFADAAPTVRDFHQLAGSPTINMGNPNGTSGPFDIDGDARVMGAALDIGGDEFLEAQPAPPGPTPAAPATPTTKKKCKKKRKPRSAGPAKKRCKKKRR